MRTSLIPSVLLATLFLLACAEETDPTTAEPDRPEPQTATLIDSIGVYEGDEPYMFGDIIGMTRDEAGRIFVADVQAHEVRVFDEDGTFLFAIGAEGEGPGEFEGPCCPVFDADGNLWVRDIYNMRYHQFDGANDFAPRSTIGMDHISWGFAAPITFDSNGHLIDVGTGRVDPETDRAPRFRRHRSLDGSTIREVQMPSAAAAEHPGLHIINSSGRAVHKPFGPRELSYHGPGGQWAYSLSSGYEVIWFDEMGDTLHVISRDVQAPEITETERERAERHLTDHVEEWGGTRSELPFGVPEYKVPIRDVFFDEMGRLWVQRRMPEGEPYEADVYNQSAELEQVVRWPRGIDLRLGWIGEDTILGTGTTEEGTPQVKVLQY